MSRVSDTRQKTREAASKIVAAGRRPHEVTVDLIYAEIRQGSRTTINEELKLWKDEQAKVDALSVALPPTVAHAMLAVWAHAVEHGEQAFEQRRSEMESELTQATAQADELRQAHAAAQAQIGELRTLLASAQGDSAAAREDARNEREAKEAALRKLDDAERRSMRERSEAQIKLDTLRGDYERRLHQQSDAHAVEQVAFRDDLARATERLEGVQKHVMLQLGEARAAHKRTESQLAKALQRAEHLATELEAQRLQVSATAVLLQQADRDRAAAAERLKQVQLERDEMKLQRANLEGRLDELMRQLTQLQQASPETARRRRVAEKLPLGG